MIALGLLVVTTQNENEQSKACPCTDAIAYGKCSPRNHTLQINISGRLGSSTSGYTLCEQSMMAEVAIDIAMVNGCKITARSISDSLTRLFRTSRTCLLSDRYLHVKVVYKR